MGKVIVIANQKGGVGKTTTVVNLGACLSELGRKVLIVDIDSQGNACSGLAVDKQNEEKSIYEVLLGEINIESVVKNTKFINLNIVPVNMHLAGAQVEFVEIQDRDTLLKRAIEPIVDKYDFILIDTPPSLGILTLNGLVAADSVLVPLQCEFYALEGLAQLLTTINLIKKNLNPELKIEGVLLTMYDSRTTLSKQVMNEAIGYFKDKVYQSIIPRNIKLAEAPSHGQPISVYDPYSIGYKAYKKLAQELIISN